MDAPKSLAITREGELNYKTMSRIFADVKTTDEVIALLGTIGAYEKSAPISDTQEPRGCRERI
jgi:hypothetical protein